MIETKRLLIRPFNLDDAKAVLELYLEPRVTRYTGDAGKVMDIDSAHNIIRDVWMAEYDKYGYGRMALVHKEEKKVIGFTGLKFLPTEQAPDLGYRMLPKYWGQGIGFEAANASLQDGFERLKLERVIAMADVDNLGSNRILTKLGFCSLGEAIYQGANVVRYEIIKEQNERI